MVRSAPVGAVRAGLGQNATGTLELAADDSTGTGLGWSVTAVTSDFVYTGTYGGTDIPAANLSLTSASAATSTAGQAVDVTNGPKASVVPPQSLSSARTVLAAPAAYGQGTYTQNLGVSLPVGEFVLHDAQGHEVSRAPVAMAAVYAGTATGVEVPLESQLRPGHYTVSLALRDDGRGVTAREDELPLDVSADQSGQDAVPGGADAADVNQAGLDPNDGESHVLGIVVFVLVMVALCATAFALIRRRTAAEAAAGDGTRRDDSGARV